MRILLVHNPEAGDEAHKAAELIELPKKIGLKSYLRLSAVLINSSPVTSSYVSTDLQPGVKKPLQLELR